MIYEIASLESSYCYHIGVNPNCFQSFDLATWLQIFL